MMANEKDRLLALFVRDTRWCQDAEARDVCGAAVRFSDPGATAWDITGAMCCLFGWKRACILFGQLERHIHKRRPFYGNRNEAIQSMITLQAFNDRPETVFEFVIAMLKTMPVWAGVPRPSNGRAARS